MKTYKLLFVFLFTTFQLLAQNNQKFSTKQEYLTYLNKKFKIEATDVYIFDALDEQAYLGKYSSVVFINGTKISTMEEIRAIDENNCAPKKFFTNLTLERIEKVFTNEPQLATVFFRNLADDSILETTNQTIALFFFSYQLGSSGLQYYKHKKALEDLNIKCILLSIDGADIAELDQSEQTPIQIQSEK
jgi:hypothetical protein